MDPRTLARLEQRDTEKHVNEISDEAQHEISAAINASARQSIRPYNSQNEYLFAMKEDLSEWLQILHSETINAYSFFRKLETGILLCKHANTVTLHAEEFCASNPNHPILLKTKIPENHVRFNEGRQVKSESFFARDNVATYINWCRNELGISDTIMFETDDLVLRKNEKNFILTLLEVARRGAKFGMDAPTIIKMEQEIEREMLIDAGKMQPDEYQDEYEPELEIQPQKVTIDFKSLDEMVQYYLGLCTCPTMFALTRVSDGKYRIGDSNALIYMRILRNHVMVRVGGGWDTLENYLNKHDPCRCNRHRAEKHIRSKYGVSSQQRLNMTMSPVPPNRYERKNVTNRLSSSLSQSTPHLAMTKTVSPRDRKISEKIRQPNNGDIENRARRVPGGVTERKKSAAQSARPLRPRSVTSESSAGAVEVKTRPKSSLHNSTWNGSTQVERERRKSTSESTEGNLAVMGMRGKSRSVTNLVDQSFTRPSVFDRLYASRPNRAAKEPNPQETDKNFIVERRENGHVINSRLSASPGTASRDRSKTPTRRKAANLTPSREEIEMNRSLPASSTRRSRPLKTEGDTNTKLKQRRSQTPSRSSTAASTPPKITTSRSPILQTTPRAKSATGIGRTFHSDPPKTRTKKMTSSERTFQNGQGSRESSMDRTVDLSVYSIKSNSAHGDHLTLEDLEMSHYAADDIKLTKPSSVSENAFQNLSLSLNNGGQPIKMIKPRQETRPGSSRSRIPIPVGRGTNGRSASPFFSNESPERADSGIDIYTDFESPTNTLRRQSRNNINNRPPDILE